MMYRDAAGPIIENSARSAWRFLVIVLIAGFVSLFGAARAQQAAPELPSEPILRVEAERHGAPILRIDTDAANKFAVTASFDKTVRVWSLPDGRLQRVLRLPIDYGWIGYAYAVAISPDGSTVAVGGFTGIDYHHNIFLFDRASGSNTFCPTGSVGLPDAQLQEENVMVIINPGKATNRDGAAVGRDSDRIGVADPTVIDGRPAGTRCSRPSGE